jgi:polysaccharide deacetylase family protein (PEP-CTERM system associated)
MNILTFDIEDWFHILDNPETKGVSEWSKFESRIHQNMETIFNILQVNNQKATFFCVGWIAEKYPEIIRKIVDSGFEIGSHTHYHQLVYEQSPLEFEKDLIKSIATLESVSGQKIKYFRAPGFSITNETPWAIETLIKNGIEIDCSLFPTERSHGGFNNYGKAEPVWIEYDGMKIKELPINLHSILGKEIVFSGGGYFRLFPYGMIKNFTKKSDYVMTYFHPRDFDAKQPMVPGLSVFRKFKSYYGLKLTEAKLTTWLKDFEFIDINSANERIDWIKARNLKMN